MSSIITSILSSTVGLLWNKARDTTAEKLKDGDVTDAQIRKIVVRELNDIKTKLDGLSRKDLLSSFCFLQEGVSLLNVSLDKTKLEQNVLLSEAEDDRGEASKMTSNATDASIFNEALELSDAMRKVKINSNKELEPARERFKDARKRATDAFCNEALSIQDRIFAAKVRIISEILEWLESPETATTGCLLFLEKLHSLPAIQDMFSVYLDGGLKSLLNKAERVENVKSVMLINQVLSHYCLKFGSKHYSYTVWPAIELTDRRFNPVLDWQEVSSRKSMVNELIQPPNRVKLDETIVDLVSLRCLAVNGLGEIVILHHAAISVVSKTGEIKCKRVHLPAFSGEEVIGQYARELAVDNNNNVYVVRKFVTLAENSDEETSLVLHVLDEKHKVKHECTLDFLHSSEILKIAVNNNDLIIIQKDYPRVNVYVYVCDHIGKLKHKFETDSCSPLSLCISNNNEIIITSDDFQDVDIYTEEGKRKSTIKVPQGHEVRDVAFHHAICKIIALAYQQKTHSYFLLCFSETGELETSTFFLKDKYPSPTVTSHPCGPAAVVTRESITFI